MPETGTPDIVIVTDDQLDEECPVDPEECNHEHASEPSVYSQDDAYQEKYHARCGLCGIVFTQVNKGSVSVQDLNIADKRPA